MTDQPDAGTPAASAPRGFGAHAWKPENEAAAPQSEAAAPASSTSSPTTPEPTAPATPATPYDTGTAPTHDATPAPASTPPAHAGTPWGSTPEAAPQRAYQPTQPSYGASADSVGSTPAPSYGAPAQPSSGSASSSSYGASAQSSPAYGASAQPTPAYGAPAQPTAPQAPYGSSQPASQQPPYGSSQPAASSSPYGAPAQQPPAQAAYGASQPASPYGAAQPSAPQPPYGTQSPYASAAPYAAQQVQPTNPYAYTPQGPAAAPPQRKSSILGIIALGVVTAATIVGSVLTFQFGTGFMDLMHQMGYTVGNMPSQSRLNTDPRVLRFMTQAAPVMQSIGLASVVGFAGWITSIVATATRRGRGYGIGGIILGVLAPVIMFVALMIAISAA